MVMLSLSGWDSSDGGGNVSVSSMEKISGFVEQGEFGGLKQYVQWQFSG